MRFFSEFLQRKVQMEEKEVRNEDYENNVILEGRPILKPKTIALSSNEKDIAHLAVLMNMAVVEPYLE